MNTIPKLDLSTISGEHPDSIDDAGNVYGDGNLTFSLKHLEGEHCERSESGMHSYEVKGGVYICVCCDADGGEA